MASGKQHAIGSIAIAAISMPAMFVALSSGATPAVLLIPIGALFGVMVTPDLDMYDYIQAGTHSRAIVRKNCGSLASFLWTLYWLPYGWMIPHRARISHAPILGTLGRLAYMTIFPAFLAISYGKGYLIWDVIKSPVFLNFFVGLCLSDMLHWIMDMRIWRIFR